MLFVFFLLCFDGKEKENEKKIIDLFEFLAEKYKKNKIYYSQAQKCAKKIYKYSLKNNKK